MTRIAAIGEEARILGFGLAGVIACPAESGEDARACWRSLDDDVSVVILTPRAADSLADQLDDRPGMLTVVMPP